MPTAAKLVSALVFLAIGFAVAVRLSQVEPTHFHWNFLPEIMALVGGYTGWSLLGRRAERGFREALAAGITSGVLVLFWTLLLNSGKNMIDRSMGRRYRGLMSGLEDMMDMMWQQLLASLRADVMILVLAGGVLGGILARYTAKLLR